MLVGIKKNCRRGKISKSSFIGFWFSMKYIYFNTIITITPQLAAVPLLLWIPYWLVSLVGILLKWKFWVLGNVIRKAHALFREPSSTENTQKSRATIYVLWSVWQRSSSQKIWAQNRKFDKVLTFTPCRIMICSKWRFIQLGAVNI